MTKPLCVFHSNAAKDLSWQCVELTILHWVSSATRFINCSLMYSDTTFKPTKLVWLRRGRRYKRWHMSASIVANSLTSYLLSSNINELTQERSHTNAAIVKSALASHQIVSNMNELTQERSHTNAAIVKSALANHQLASAMNELTQERSRTIAGIVKSALANHQLASAMNELTQERSHTNVGKQFSIFYIRFIITNSSWFDIPKF